MSEFINELKETTVCDKYSKEECVGISENTYESEYNKLIMIDSVIKYNGEVVCSKQSDIVDITSDELKIKIKILSKSNVLTTGHNTRIEFCEDGTVVRLYFHDNKWRTATTKCIDASESYWSSRKSFDQLFWEVFDSTNVELLDTGSTYVFILLHVENRIVVKHNKNNLVFVARIDNKTSKEYTSDKLVNVWRPVTIKDLDLDNVDGKFWDKKRGVIIKTNGVIYKIDFSNYKVIKDIRGNVSDIRLRYFELLSDPDQSKLSSLVNVFPEYSNIFANFCTVLDGFITYIYKLYVDSHIKHIVKVTDDNKYIKLLKGIHSQYKTTGLSISIIDVQQKILSLHPNVIRSLLNMN